MTLNKEGLEAARITQKYIRRYPDSKRTRSWAGRMVHIETENGVWRTNGHGYTYAGRPDAWILPFEQAMQQVGHCGPEKRAAFIRVTLPAPDGLVERLNRGVLHKAWMGCDLGEVVTGGADVGAANALMSEAATVIQTQADQIERLTWARDNALKMTAIAVETAGEQSARAEAAEQQVRDMMEDAERYQYLRTRDLDTIEQGGVFAGLTPNNVVLNGDDLDVAIDAARLALKSQESDRG
jgi:hypothetical protein